jgi:hypothetical protein
VSYDALLIHTVTIRNLVAPAGTSDRYGDAVFATTDTVEKARVQQLDGQEVNADRDTRVTQYRIFLKTDSVITVFSSIIWNGDTYAVTGEPSVVDGLTGPHHIEAMLTKREG